ncbi:MAG: LD-carboxypeptidase [Chitinophagales bacterium]|nr:LD-carboxypeptidase [Chitinophagales bacterium]
MYIPPFLKIGDTVGLISTARKIHVEEVEFAIQLFEKKGFKVKLGKTIGAECNQFAGDDRLRKSDLQNMLDDTHVKAVICCRGGYGTVKIIDDINYTNFLNHPKWIVGYSDVSVLHVHINNLMGISTLHATMPINYEGNSTVALDSLFDLLSGKTIHYHFDSHPLNRSGKANAQVIGGNLSILYSLLGTKTYLNTSNKILFIEDLDEYLYHIDRMMSALKRSGKLNNLSGLIIGGMTDMHDNNISFGKSAEEIIREYTEEFTYPICFNFPAGHISDNRAIAFGVEAELNIEKNEVFFSQHF